ncbi:hypothetical protein DSO57_1004899 [Entomophthora muscae]|uniref:Uncharacterized protein n=1 Tax=Entomophthora muscae TaxID=34485 RepID=A0ACC2TVS9_9FUNG|nr:hypothetical protein DSO57_1004899 [Entomophthora muscae]
MGLKPIDNKSEQYGVPVDVGFWGGSKPLLPSCKEWGSYYNGQKYFAVAGLGGIPEQAWGGRRDAKRTKLGYTRFALLQHPAWVHVQVS